MRHEFGHEIQLENNEIWFTNNDGWGTANMLQSIEMDTFGSQKTYPSWWDLKATNILEVSKRYPNLPLQSLYAPLTSDHRGVIRNQNVFMVIPGVK